MNEIKKILNLRIKKETEKRLAYTKYILNSHLLMFLLILVGAIIFNYSNWLKNSTKIELYSVIFIIQILLIYILTTIKVKTYIKDADSVFLLPQEENYKSIIKSIILNTISKKFFLIIIFIFASYPIIHVLGIEYKIIFYFLSMLISTIFLTFYKFYKVFYDHLNNKDNVIIFLIYLFILINLLFIDILIPFFILSILLFLIFNRKLEKYINWENAAKYDNNRIEKYLKFINMFVDVPIKTVKVARRKYFDILLRKLDSKNFNSNNAYKFYYLRSFLRQQNTVFLLARLLVVMLFVGATFKNIYVSSVTIVFFSYLSIIQLIPMYRKFNNILWCYILPIEEHLKLKSFILIIKRIVMIFSAILSIILVIVDFSVANCIVIFIVYIVNIELIKYLLKKSL